MGIFGLQRRYSNGGTRPWRGACCTRLGGRRCVIDDDAIESRQGASYSIISIRSCQPCLCTSKGDAWLRNTHAAKPIHRMACAQPVHVRSIEEQCQTQRESGDPCSLYPQAARSKRRVGTVSRHTFGISLDRKYTYLSKSSRGQMCLFKERNSNLASDDA